LLPCAGSARAFGQDELPLQIVVALQAGTLIYGIWAGYGSRTIAMALPGCARTPSIPGAEAWPLRAKGLARVLLRWTFYSRGRRVYLPRQAGNARINGERHDACGPPSSSSHREKSGPISHRHANLRVGTLRKIYGHSFAAGQSPDTSLYELLEMPGSHMISDLHAAMLQQDYDDGLLERKVKKVICRK
jgi:hypothetical protein